MFLYFQAVYYSYVRNITINSELISENYIQEHITVLYSMKLVLKMVYLITYNVVNNIFPTSLKMKYWLMSIQIMKMDYLNQIHWLLEIRFIVMNHFSVYIHFTKNEVRDIENIFRKPVYVDHYTTFVEDDILLLLCWSSSFV